ncbi:PREDICTED: uncharacterized protein LOC109175333 [Ipomoea nil]|uniref:uncharacterized protein LOC109175333 n=1 Tax=Ipomoea nil TaxID=35883 RepID=UPI000900C79C|nr:PREDICTED: uncharacterized protein LOC109175333 [Ipomoea nil]
MGAERHGSKRGGGYVGGFLQLFDWNAKSRKKLFSSKSDSPEHSKQKKRCDGNLPMTRYHLIDEDEINASSSFKGSSSYSCASSVTDEEECGVKAPGVVARLMGLDPLPPSNFSEFYSTPFSDTQSRQGPYWHSRNLEYSKLDSKHQKVISRPIEKFQTEVLPPKSAKSIPITHHKLLSPIKSATFIPPENAAHIMEAAARIIEPGPQVTARTKMPSVGSSSGPLKVKDLKEKVEASQKPTSRRPSETNATKYLKAHSANKTRERVPSDSEESFGGTKSKGKSISLALQAKANVQKREGLNPSGKKESCDEFFKSQPVAQRNIHKKPSAINAPNVLRQNNQKQNCFADRGKSPSKPLVSSSQGKRTLTGDSSFSRQKGSTKNAENSKLSSRRLSLELNNDRKEEVFSSKKSVVRKKRPIDGDFHSEKNPTLGNVSSIHKSGKLFQSGGLMDREGSCAESSKWKGTDIVSFTFNAPLARSMEKKSTDFNADYRSKKMHHHSPDRLNSLKLPLGHDSIGGNDLSTLLEQKLRELTEKVEPSLQTTVSTFQVLTPGQSALTPTTFLHENSQQDPMDIDDPVSQHHFVFSSTDSQELTMKHKRQAVEGMDQYSSNRGEMKKLFDRRFPSPVSVLEHSYFSESCNYSDTDSNTTPSSKQSSSIQAQEVIGISPLKRFHSREADAELLDSASSTSSVIEYGKSPEWGLEYVKEILGNIDLMFEGFATGRDSKIINPRLFDQLESRKVANGWGREQKLQRKVVFDCVSECLESMCTSYVGGGYDMWVKGVAVITRKERLAEEVYREVSGWSCMRDSMVDELVDKDMSTHRGKWMDFEIEAFELGLQVENRLLNSLLDEVISDLLVL